MVIGSDCGFLFGHRWPNVRFCELARAKVTELFDELEIAHRDELPDNCIWCRHHSSLGNGPAPPQARVEREQG